MLCDKVDIATSLPSTVVPIVVLLAFLNTDAKSQRHGSAL